MPAECHPFRPLITAAIALAGFAAGMRPIPVDAQMTGMVEFLSDGEARLGLSLFEQPGEMIVLGRDGRMHTIEPRDRATRLRRVGQPYEPISAVELRGDLLREFGNAFEVVATQNFLVVQPSGRGKRWPRLFEQSHRGFIEYMSKRGVKVRRGRFPMVAVVFPDENAMYMEFRKLGIDVSRVAGLYAGESNRVITHDGGREQFTAATVRHEAAHQSAYNSGIHSRINDTPRFITEGIGQMFEPAGITSTRTGAGVAGRINWDSLTFLRREFRLPDDGGFNQAVSQLVEGDDLFRSVNQVVKAYSVAWAMMFYLAEREPKRFATLLHHTARRPAFRDYPRAERVRDFERIVGDHRAGFASRVQRFIASL